MNYDIVTIVDKIKQVFGDYEHRRNEEILGSQSKATRISKDQVDGLIGRVNACRELRNALYTAFGVNP
jgi:hypothetical protein